MKNISLSNSVHVRNLNTTLLSVVHICDQGELVKFTANEAVILNKKKFTVDEDDVQLIASRKKATGLNEISSTRDDDRSHAP